MSSEFYYSLPPTFEYYPSISDERVEYQDRGESKEDLVKAIYDEIKDKSMENDLLFRLMMFNSPKVANLITWIVFHRTLNLENVEVKTNYEIPNPALVSVKLDASAEDEERFYDYEMQSRNLSNKELYSKSLMYIASASSKYFVKGTDRAVIKPLSIVFFTSRDILSLKRACYKAPGEDFKDSLVEVVYVNMEYTDVSTPEGKLIHDGKQRDPDDMYFPILRERMREIKDKERGMREIKDAFDIVEERGERRGEARGIAKGEENVMRTVITNLKAQKKSEKEMALTLGCDVAVVNRILATM